MIFHIPNSINLGYSSGSQLRPIKMLNAFRKIGYHVDVVMGDVSSRKKQIKKIKQEILKGEHYEFLYSESSTMPTILTEKHHLPVAPFLDFRFFSFCKKYNIKIALFYRDIHWKFEQYTNSVSNLKRKYAELFYKYDLRQYKKLLDILYLPSIQMYNFIPFEFEKRIIELPPGCELRDVENKQLNESINFIYVGGLGSLYDLGYFVDVINELNNTKLFLCTRKNEWAQNQGKYDFNNKTVIYHKSGEALNDVYIQSDIAVLFVKPSTYWKFVMAVKLFEYISFKKPIIAVKGTAIGDFIERNDIGWVVEYDKNKLKELITHLKNNRQDVKRKIKNIERIQPDNTWVARVKKVQGDLTRTICN